MDHKTRSPGGFHAEAFFASFLGLFFVEKKYEKWMEKSVKKCSKNTT